VVDIQARLLMDVTWTRIRRDAVIGRANVELGRSQGFVSSPSKRLFRRLHQRDVIVIVGDSNVQFRDVVGRVSGFYLLVKVCV
jgi:hypothetical protein